MFNFDILLNDGDVERCRKLYPEVADFLDWPRLRQVFAPRSLEADRQRRVSHRRGVRAVALGVAALSLAAVEPQLEAYHPPAFILPAIVIALSLASVALGSRILHGAAKERWLDQRTSSERLRQLNFQWLARRAVEISTADSAQRAQLLKERDHLLDALGTELDPALTPVCDRVVADLGARQAWLVPRSTDLIIPSAAEPVGRQLSDAYLDLRLKHQIAFAERKLRDDTGLWPSTPKSQSERFEMVALFATAAVAVIHLMTLFLSGRVGARRAARCGSPVLAPGGCHDVRAPRSRDPSP